MSDQKKKAAGKRFAPKVPQAKGSSVAAPSSSDAAGSKVSTSADQKGARKPKTRAQKPRQKKQDRFVQQEGGIFSEGIGQTKTKQPSASASRAKASATAATTVTSTARQGSPKRTGSSPTKKASSRRRQIELSDDETDDDAAGHTDLQTGFAGKWLQKTAVQDRPVVLPLRHDVNRDVTAAPSAMDVDHQGVPEASDGARLQELAEHDAPLLFFQFPDVLPAAPTTVKQEPGSSSAAPASQPESQPRNLTVADLPEGHIGKLRVHASGRITLVIGSAVFDVTRGVRGDFLQDVAVIDSVNEPASITNIGPLSERFLVVPDVDQLAMDDLAV